MLGTEGLKEGGAGDFSTWVKDKRFDLGDVPLRIGGKLSSNEQSNYKQCDAKPMTKLTNVNAEQVLRTTRQETTRSFSRLMCCGEVMHR